MKIAMLEGLLPGFREELCREGKAERTVTEYVQDTQRFLTYGLGIGAVERETAGEYAAAETFLGGGTNFVTPLRETLRLMGEQGFDGFPPLAQRAYL